MREVGPRDGLQVEAPMPPGDRVRLIEALVAAGIADIEVASFVSPKAVPAMADAAEVVAAARAGVGAGGRPTLWALVPNRRGAQDALAAGVDALTVTISASETYSQNNTRRSVTESIGEVERLLADVHGRVPTDVIVSCAFGSPYEGDIDPGEVADLSGRLRDAGASVLTLADTTGMATPARLESVLAVTGTDVGLHLHETRGTGLVNAYAAWQAGVVRFDTSVGGLGGSPFAAGAAGNLATEDLVYLLDELGVTTGIDLDGVLAASRLVAGLIGRPVPSRVASAGPRLAAG